MNVKLAAILISDPVNIRYLTGFMGLAPEEREAYCLILGNQVFLFTSSLYREQASKLSPAKQDLAPRDKYTNKQIIVSVFSREKPIEIMLNEILTKSDIKTLAFEKYNVTVAEYEKLQKELPGITLVPSFGKIEKMRMIKSEHEINTIKKACALTDACLTHLLSYIKEGQTESEIAWEIESFFHKNGASSAFSPIIAFNEHASEPHYASTDSCKLSANSLILLDFGAKLDGYCADMTRVVFLGKPKDEWVKSYETVRKAQQNALDYVNRIKPSGAKADEIAKKVISDAGCPVYPHGLGHGVGLAIHEAPRLSVSRDESLLPGHVFSVEPGIYIEGKYGIRIEDLVVLTDRGTEILSTSEKGLTIL